MRTPAVSFAHKLIAAILAALLTFALVPTGAFAIGEDSSEGTVEAVTSDSPDQPNASADSSLGEPQEVSAEQDAEGSPVAPMLASGLVGKPGSFINSDVALDSEPVVGSFTVDGLTFAVTDESHVELVGVAPSVILSEGSEAAGPSVTLSEAAEGGVVEEPNSDQASEAGLANLMLPETITYEGATYTLDSIAPYAFYLSGVTDVMLPASVSDVDDRAFRSSDVASVEVAEGNPTYSSFDGTLYDADQLSLLLIPEGKQGTVRIPKTAEVVDPSVFSHCPLVDSISVDAGGAAFASENGLLYTSDLTTLLRVPAGATEVTIREGCTTIAAGVLEACMKLTTINAPASVTSISPDVFHAIPTVSLPAASVILNEGIEGPEVEESNEGSTSEANNQITAMVALSSIDDDLPETDPSSITVALHSSSGAAIWERAGFAKIAVSSSSFSDEDPQTNMGSASSYSAFVGQSIQVTLNQNGGTGASIGTLYFPYGKGDIYINRELTIGWTSRPMTLPRKNGYTCSGYYLNPNGTGTCFINQTGYPPVETWVGSGWMIVSTDCTAYAKWTPISYSITYDLSGGNLDGSQPTSYNIETANFKLPAPTRSGYAFKGWSGSNGATPAIDAYVFKGSTGNRSYTAHWTPNSYTVQYRNKADTATLSTDTGFKYDTARALAAKPTSGVSAGYTAVGWATAKNQSSATYEFGSSQKNLATSGTKKLYLAEKANPYTIVFYSQGGPTVPSISATYDQDVTLPAPGARNGYRFTGWNTEADGSGTAYQAGIALTKPNLATSGTAKLFAQWDATISALVPLDVEAQVDVLGLEAPKEAQGYIESRCGEPLKVARVDLTPLDGAKELFGAGNVAEVFLEVLANSSASPNARFSLGASATESDASKLQAFTMSGYGTKVPISYRFAMPPEVQTSLVEYADPQPVCSVAYTVALA